MITIIDYGAGNLASVSAALRKIGARVQVASTPEQLAAAEKLLLPGVGSLGWAMQRLRDLGLVEVLNRKVLEEKTPILGICLGLQMFGRWSEEGNAAGLGWIAAETRRFRPDPSMPLKVPHVGWSEVQFQKSVPILAGVSSTADFYFAHSYYVRCDHPADVLATSCHGHEFVSAAQVDNIVGVQFHPEKSHRNGLALIRNFVHS